MPSNTIAVGIAATFAVAAAQALAGDMTLASAAASAAQTASSPASVAASAPVTATSPAVGAASAPAPAPLKGVELLFDYTKFHITAYLTLVTSFLTLASLKRKNPKTQDEDFVFSLRKGYVWAAVIFIGIAGFSGGVVISTITECYDIKVPNSCPTSHSFLYEIKTGPYGVQLWPGHYWAKIEHTTFWIGLLCAALAFARNDPIARAWNACIAKCNAKRR